jgi:integrase
MGLGRAGKEGVSLPAARIERDRLIALLRDGIDPLAERARRKAEQASKRTFGEVAKAALAGKAAGWKGGERSSSFRAWSRTLTREAKPIHQRRVDEIGVNEVKAVVAPIWTRGGHCEARLALTRLAAVFDYAIAHGYRASDNPAAWKLFKHIAPARPHGDGQPHKAIHWRDAPAALARLRQCGGMAGLSLEFAILTGVRIGEALGATFAEIDLDRALWVIPAARMKRGQEHVVPLSEPALGIVKALHKRRGKSGLVFPGQRPSRPLNRQSVYEVCKQVTEGKSSIHGWRSTLRTFCSDNAVPFEVSESILAHGKGSKIVAAYDRSDLLARRAPIMEEWSRYLSGEEPAGATVVPLKRPA